MKTKIITYVLLVISFISCVSVKSQKRDNAFQLEYRVENIPVYFELETVSILFAKNDITSYLQKSSDYDAPYFLEYLSQTTDTVRISPYTIFPAGDVRNKYRLAMDRCAYQLLLERKCEIILKKNNKIVKEIIIEHKEGFYGSEYTDFSFVDGTSFYTHFTALGE
jgi:hypothetical protein